MVEYGIGMMARSLAGHDKGNVYMILSSKDGYVYLADGVYRTLEKPKKKKIKHVQTDHHVAEWIQRLLDDNKKIQNSDIIKARRDYGSK